MCKNNLKIVIGAVFISIANSYLSFMFSSNEGKLIAGFYWLIAAIVVLQLDTNE